MKTLLALSIALLSLNLYGAEKINFSLDGLEGWGKKEGVFIVVEDYPRDKTFDAKAIKNQVELKLRLAGIKISEKSLGHDDFIIINMLPTWVGDRVIGYNILILPSRTMTFKYNGKEYRAFMSQQRYYRAGTPRNYRPVFETLLDQLLLDYLKANPKPKEKKSLKEP